MRGEGIDVEDRDYSLTPHPTPYPQPSLLTEDEPGALAAVGALALVAFLIIGVFWGMANPAGESLYTQRQANTLLSEGHYSEAATILERALTRYDAPELRLDLSYAYLARRDAERAERQAQRAITSASADLKPAAWAQLGRVLAFTGRSNDAQDAWTEAISSAVSFRGISPVETEVRSAIWHMAMLQWSRLDYGATSVSLQSLLNTEDTYALSARVKLAQLLAPTNSDISRKHLQVIERELPHLSIKAALPDLRVPGLREGLDMEVITSTVAGLKSTFIAMDKARKGGASQASISALWGRAFLQQGEPYLAKTYLQRAVEAQPGLADAHSFLALALTATGDAAGALNQLKIAVDLVPQRPLPHYALAGLYIQKEDWDHVSKELSALKKLEPDTPQFHIQLGEYYSQRGAYDAAEEEYIAAMNKQASSSNNSTPTSGPASSILEAALALSRFYTDVRGMGCEKGLPAARISLNRNPGDPSSYDAVGWSLVQCDKPDEALSSLEHATKAIPDSPRFHFHLGKAYALLGRQADARSEYNKVIDLDPGGLWERQAVAALPKLKEAGK